MDNGWKKTRASVFSITNIADSLACVPSYSPYTALGIKAPIFRSYGSRIHADLQDLLPPHTQVVHPPQWKAADHRLPIQWLEKQSVDKVMNFAFV
jgi:hypothetical protein